MYMRIRCDYCKQSWEVYSRDIHNRDNGAARRCPHCDAKISKELWKGYVLPAFNAAASANFLLAADHVDAHSPLFTVAFIPDHLFPARSVEDILAEEEIIPNLD